MSARTASDQAQRAAALNPEQSCIVQAPAGSGKTELLTQRYLALLARVERPQQILAITFTRKAAAEMRIRLLDALNAATGPRPTEPHKQQTWDLARAVLEHDLKQDWCLSQNPAQLKIQTIDSFNAGLVRRMPWLSRFGSQPQVAEDAAPLYLRAVERLLDRLGSGKPGDQQLRTLLSHLDNRATRLQQMLLAMLARRDQWLRHVYRQDSEDPCADLEVSLAGLIEQQLAQLDAAAPQDLTQEILACGRYAAAQLADKERALLYLTDLDWWPRPQSDHLPVWQGIADLLLTGKDELRRPGGINVKCGFPAADREMNQQMKQLVEKLEGCPEFISLLAACRALPAAEYLPDQRRVLIGLIELLPLLVAELWIEFRRSGQADFAEIALMAREALGTAEDPAELLLQIDSRLEHILVDEFQDTSRLQYGLLEVLTAGWQPGDGRTLFLVGDPMQSIYLFREAEVGLFLKSFGGRFGDDGPVLQPLQLSCNFRSQQGLVDWVNRVFSRIFPQRVDLAAGAVPHATAEAFNASGEAPAVSWCAFSEQDEAAEAKAVADRLTLVRSRQPQARIAILVRGRNHLRSVLRELRAEGISYQAQDIDQLGSRPAALDLLALYRATSSRADRLAWLSVLRAPWCGLDLADLEALCRAAGKGSIPQLLETGKEIKGLSPIGFQCLQRCRAVLLQALTQRGRLPLRQLLERCWLALGGPACYEAEGYEDACRVLDLVEKLQQGTDLRDPDQLEREMERLFAVPNNRADGSLQIMTIHKSKGLEFDHVLLPGLGRAPAQNDSPLLRWLEHPQVGLLLAPIAARDGSEQDRIYRLIGQLEQQKQDYEATRLLYVAATRARQQLHLFGHARENRAGELVPAANSLLAKLWPVCADDFSAAICPLTSSPPQTEQLMLKRLPLQWQIPAFEGVAVKEGVCFTRASGGKGDLSRQELVFSGWEEQTSRQIGTVVHALLEQLAQRGPDRWLKQTAAERRDLLSQRLGAAGVAISAQEAALGKVQMALERTLNSERGRWLLHPHSESACELDLTGKLNGKIVHAVIDRTFVTDQGERWVIDYKTSTPKKGESTADFIRRELEHYRGQLEHYRQLLRLFQPEQVVRAALYFPLLDTFVEVDDAT